MKERYMFDLLCVRTRMLTMLLLFVGAALHADESMDFLSSSKTRFSINNAVDKITHQPVDFGNSSPVVSSPITKDFDNLSKSNDNHNARIMVEADNQAWSSDDEFLVDTNVQYSATHAYECFPAVAFDGTNCFVVWEYMHDGTSDIYGARITQSGIVLDQLGIIIAAEDGMESSPAVAFNGTNYLAVWEEWQYDLTSFRIDLYCARVSLDGIVLDQSGIAIASVSGTSVVSMAPRVASDGTNYLVVWQDNRNGLFDLDIYGVRVSPDGVIIDSMGFPISPATNDGTLPAVIFDGADYFVAWQNTTNSIIGARVSPDGVVLDPTGFPVSPAATNAIRPALSFDGTNYLVVWQNASGIKGARVSQDGVIIDSMGFPISPMADTATFPKVAFDGINYMVVWQAYDSSTSNDLYGARVATDGTVLDTAGFTIAIQDPSQAYSAIVYDGFSYHVVWTNYTSGYKDIYGTRVSTDGILLDSAIVISTEADAQHNPSIAFDSVNYLVVWQDDSVDLGNIYGARVSPDGTILDPSCIAVAISDADQSCPAVAFDGDNYLVVWQYNFYEGEQDRIMGTWVNQDGVVLNQSGFLISNEYGRYENRPAVAFAGNNYLVVWADHLNGTMRICGARVNCQSGLVLDNIAINVAGENSSLPAVASSGTNYLVVWKSPDGIAGARVSQDGAILDPIGINISVGAHLHQYPSVAFDGTNYLVVWQDNRNGSFDIYGVRVSADGVVLDPEDIVISGAAMDQREPAVVFDGTNFMAVWEDYQNSEFSDLYGAKISPSGVVIESFAVSVKSGNQSESAIAHGQGSQLFITYAGWCDSVNTHPTNTMRIWGTFYSATGISEDYESNASNTDCYLQIVPNPFSNQAKIEFSIPQGLTQADLKIYDVSGRMVRQFNNLSKQLCNEVTWSGDDNAGRRLAAGIYFCHLEAGAFKTTRKVVITE